jgi:hypothetical protein
MVRRLDRRNAEHVRRYWLGKLILRLDSVSHLKTAGYPLLKVREVLKLALRVQTMVQVGSPHDIFRFLSNCRYRTDRELFGVGDYWQLPDEFEKRREGDCDDHALWAWRKCVELGENARFTIGTLDEECHAWVTLVEGRESFVFEAVEKYRLGIIHALKAKRYEPSYSVDSRIRF